MSKFKTTINVIYSVPLFFTDTKSFEDYVKSYLSSHKPSWLSGFKMLPSSVSSYGVYLMNIALDIVFDVETTEGSSGYYIPGFLPDPPEDGSIDMDPGKSDIEDYFSTCFMSYSGPELVDTDGEIFIGKNKEFLVSDMIVDAEFNCGSNSDEDAELFYAAFIESNIKLIVNKILEGVDVRSALIESGSSNDLVSACKKMRYKCSGSDGEYIITCNDNGYKVIDNDGTYTLNHLYSSYVETGLDFETLIKDLEKQVGDFEYACGFGVFGFIHPGRERDARDYLSDDDMVQYYDGAQVEDIKSIVWDLERKQAGHIYIVTTARLKKKALDDLKSFIDGQNSDGLGEGFEQQSFITMRDPGSTIEAGYIYKYSGFESKS